MKGVQLSSDIPERDISTLQDFLVLVFSDKRFLSVLDRK